jgi:hypothetical protein
VRLGQVISTGDYTGDLTASLTAVKPLQAVAMGLVIVLLTASVDGYDLLADPVGWLLVLVGLAGLPEASVPRRGTLQKVATLALVISIPVWVPAARDALNVTDPSLAWAASIPQLLTVIVLAHSLAQAANLAADANARRWLQTARTLMIVVALLPPIVLGGGLDSLVGAVAVVGSLSLLLLIVLLFRYAGRPWALPADRPPAVAQD